MAGRKEIMELNELILLAAASLRASYEHTREESVVEAKLLWLEVLKQDNLGE